MRYRTASLPLASPKPTAAATTNTVSMPQSSLQSDVLHIGVLCLVALVVVAVASLVARYMADKWRSEQSPLTVAALLASAVGVIIAITQVQVLLQALLIAALAFSVVFGICGIRIAERKAKQTELLVEGLVEIKKSSSSEGTEASSQAPQTVTAAGVVTLPVMSWPTRMLLSEQLADLIRNSRSAAAFIRKSSEENYMRDIAMICEHYVSPAVTIRQSMRRVVGYPSARPLDRLPMATNADEFLLVAEVFERLFRMIPEGAPAATISGDE